MRPIIIFDGISKSYRIGAKTNREDMLRDVIINSVKKAVKRIRNPYGGSHGNDTEFWALKDISFEVNQGDVIGIIGRNGAGKSTLLKILSKITAPTTGEIKVKGRVASLLEVGTGFHQELTGRENIYLNGAILGMRRAEVRRKFDEIVAFAEVEKFLDTPVKRYSSGMYVRLAFSVAAHLEPEILVVDEVLAVGDIRFQKKCMGKMEAASRGGRTILFVSHNMGALRNLCNRAILLDAGHCVMQGGADRVVDYYVGSSNDGAKSGTVKDRKRARASLATRMKITDVQIRNARTGGFGDASTLDDLDVIIEYEVFDDVKYFSAEWRFKDNQGVPVCYSSSAPMGNVVYHPKTNRGRVICKIKEIPYSVGEYILDVGLGIPGVDFLDYVEDACRLNIIVSDPEKTGYQYKRELAPVFIKCDWHEHSNY